MMDWKGVAGQLKTLLMALACAKGERDRERKRLGLVRKACLVCVTKAKAFQEF